MNAEERRFFSFLSAESAFFSVQKLLRKESDTSNKTGTWRLYSTSLFTEHKFLFIRQ
jgi:hypothetical protein